MLTIVRNFSIVFAFFGINIRGIVFLTQKAFGIFLPGDDSEDDWEDNWGDN